MFILPSSNTIRMIGVLKAALSQQTASQRRIYTAGFSLIETLLVLSLLSMTILPLTIVLSQSAQGGRSTSIQATRTLLLSDFQDEMSADRPTYTSLFNDSAMNTILSDTGQTIPFMRKVDTSNSNTFQRTLYFYQYTNSTDPVTSPRSKIYLSQTIPEFRLRCGNTAGYVDSSGYFWNGDSNAYDGTNKVPGYVTGSSGTTGSNIQPIVNSSDDSLFQYYREGTGSTNVNYNFDVTNANYTVKLYFAEVNATITNSSPNRRLMDIYIEGALQNSTAYSPYETTGGTYRANIKSYDVAVSDGVLNISIRRNASSNNDARISGILVRRKRAT